MERKIAIPTEDQKGLDGTVNRHFGRCNFFTIVTLLGADCSIENVETISNPGSQASGGAGPLATQTVVSQKVGIVAGVELYGYPADVSDGTLKVKELIQMIKEKRLSPYRV